MGLADRDVVACRSTRVNALEGAMEHPAMEYGAIDVALGRRQVRIIDESEQVVLDRRVNATRNGFDRVFTARSVLWRHSRAEREIAARAARIPDCGTIAIVLSENRGGLATRAPDNDRLDGSPHDLRWVKAVHARGH